MLCDSALPPATPPPKGVQLKISEKPHSKPSFLYQGPARLGKGLWLSYSTLTQVETKDQQNTLKWLEVRVGMVDVHGRKSRRLEIQSHHTPHQRACVVSLSGQEQGKCELGAEGCVKPKEELHCC